MSLQRNGGPAEVRRGAQRPRIFSAPRYESSWGPEVVELCAAAGLILDPWQQFCLEVGMAEGLDNPDLWAAFETGFVVPRQNGKGPHALTTPILTTNGWTTIGAIQPGQQVYGANGLPTSVVACSEVFSDLDCYEVEFTDGAVHVVAGEHLWPVFDKDMERWTDVRTDHLSRRYRRTRRDNGRTEYRYRVRCDAQPDTPTADLPIDPYLLGYWLGDGSRCAPCITAGRDDLEWVRSRLSIAGAEIYRVDAKDSNAIDIRFRIDRSWSSTGFLPKIRQLGVFGNKHIPEVYLTASIEQRMALLAGLMDSDGSIAVTNRSPQVEFSSSFPGLATSFLRLVRSLGIRVRSTVRPTTGRDNYRFAWTPTFDPFEMPRKSERFKPPASARQSLMSIVGVRQILSVPTRCIQVDRTDGVYLVGHQFTPSHNSVLMARELGGLFVVGERLIVHTAHEFKTAAEAFVRVSTLIENCDMLRKRVKQVRLTTGQEGIQLLNGAWLKFLARTKGSGRGLTGDLVILDEAQILGDGPVRALVPTLSARPNPQIWYAGTAGTDLSIQLGSVRNRALKGGDPSLAYLEWSVDENDFDPADPEDWAKANPALGIRISEGYVAKERRTFSGDLEGFAAERLGVGDWPSEDGNEVISREQWAACFDGDLERSSAVCFSVDVNPERSACAIAVAGRRGDAFLAVELADHRPGLDWVVDRVVELVKSWRPLGVVIDRAGPAGTLLAPLETAGVDPELLIIPTGQEFAQAAAGFYDEVVRGTLRHPGDPRLDAAVACAIQLPRGDTWVWARRKSRGDVCPLVAASLARWGFLRQDAGAEPAIYF